MLTKDVIEVKTHTPREMRVKLAERGITSSEFARMVGVSGPSMSCILHGKQNPTKFTWLRIAQVLRELEREPLPEEERPEPILLPRVRSL